jgi:hypothetical protein
MLQRTLPAGFIAPCLPTKTDKLPSGGQWLHEIKHDGFRIIARKDGDRVRLYSRPGNDFTRRFPLIAEALTGLRSRSCIIDGEAVACDDNGLASFERIRYRQHDGNVFLYAFDLIELNGDDLRRDPLEVRKATLASIPALHSTKELAVFREKAKSDQSCRENAEPRRAGSAHDAGAWEGRLPARRHLHGKSGLQDGWIGPWRFTREDHAARHRLGVRPVHHSEQEARRAPPLWSM